MKTYDPTNWYWYVANNLTQVFSSAAGAYVPATDQTFVNWLSDGSTPTKIDTEENLGAVLAPYLVRPTAPGVLDAYQGTQASTVAQHVAFKVLFNLLKRVAVLEGKPAPTAAQALSFAKALM